MFELPKFTPVEDNTGSLLLKAAEQAREQQQQFQTLVQKNEQIRQEAFGGLQKQIFDIASAQNLPVEVQRNILKDGLNKITALYKDRKNVRATDLSMMALESVMNAKNTAGAYQGYILNGEKAIADKEKEGFDGMNLKTALSKSLFDEQVAPDGSIVRVPKDPMKLGDPVEFLKSEIESNSQKYLDRAKSDAAVNKAIGDYKPNELKISSKKDLTGNLTTTVAYTEKKYPFTRVEDRTVDGLTGKENVLDTVDQTILGKPTPVLSDKAAAFFEQHPDPIVRAELVAKGRDYIDNHNRRLGINPQQITKENFDLIAAQFSNLPPDQQPINPFDEGNKKIFSRLAITEKLMPQFGRFGDISVSRDRAKPQSSGGGGGGDYDPSLYDKRGNLRPEGRFPTAFAQIVKQDADVMRVSEPATFVYNGNTITGKRVGDRAYGQIVRDNGARATIVARPNEPDTIYIVELDDDNNLTDNVTRLSGQEAVDFGAKIASANGSDLKTFQRLWPKVQSTVVPMTQNDKNLAVTKIEDADRKKKEIDAGESFLVNLGLLKQMKSGETKNLSVPARVKIDGKEVSIKSIERKNTSWWQDSPVVVTPTSGAPMTFKHIDEFIEKLKTSNK